MTDNLLADAAERIFSDHADKALLDAAERGEFPEALWSALFANGFHELAIPDTGVPLADAFAVIGLAGRYAAPVPLGEVLFANRWLADSSRLVTVGEAVDGRIIAPWGRRADAVLGLDSARGAFVLVESPVLTATSANLAGEPRDVVDIPRHADWMPLTEPAVAYMALARGVATAGCLARILDLSLQYAGEREQFGRPIARFQAIQHNLAIMAGEVAAAGRAADAGVDALGTDRVELEVAAAKARIGEAAGVVAEIAHQVHGAMGYTHEHQLHHFTRRAWAWRDEYGNETLWQQRLGRHLIALGAERVWDFLATNG